MPRGTIVRFEGAIDDPGSPGAEGQATVLIRSNYLTRVKGAFEGAWSLDWDTGKESTAPIRLSVAYLRQGEAQARDIRFCTVRLVDQPLAALKAERAGSGMTVTVEPVNGVVPQACALKLAGLGKELTCDAKGAATISSEDLRPPLQYAVPRFVFKTATGATELYQGGPLPIVSEARFRVLPATARVLNTSDPYDVRIGITYEMPGDLKPKGVVTADADVTLGGSYDSKEIFFRIIGTEDAQGVRFIASGPKDELYFSEAVPLAALKIDDARNKQTGLANVFYSKLSNFVQRFNSLVNGDTTFADYSFKIPSEANWFRHTSIQISATAETIEAVSVALRGKAVLLVKSMGRGSATWSKLFESPDWQELISLAPSMSKATDGVRQHLLNRAALVDEIQSSVDRLLDGASSKNSVAVMEQFRTILQSYDISELQRLYTAIWLHALVEPLGRRYRTFGFYSVIPRYKGELVMTLSEYMPKNSIIELAVRGLQGSSPLMGYYDPKKWRNAVTERHIKWWDPSVLIRKLDTGK